jgi:hypothetical protein
MCPRESRYRETDAPIHPSDPWPLPSHPEAMKMSCRRGYFHTSAWKRNSANFAFWGFSEVRTAPALCGNSSYVRSKKAAAMCT